MISSLIVLSGNAWSSEAALQVAFVYNFIKFIDWPAETPSPSLRLCVVGANKEMHEALDQLNGKSANKREIELVYLTAATNASPPLESCQMIYRPSRSMVIALPQQLPKGVVLVAHEQDQRDPSASIILIRNSEGRIEFEVNPTAIAQAGIKISSQLLKLAKNAQAVQAGKNPL
ncbi:MAG TPA: YfiR family protein [Cellvibrio sp.]|nr:YfiR family protein [Cellvibrio sp.]